MRRRRPPGVDYFQGEGLDAIVAYFVTTSSPPDARNRRWIFHSRDSRPPWKRGRMGDNTCAFANLNPRGIVGG